MNQDQTGTALAPVPDIILSFIKDERYLSQTVNLITHVLKPFRHGAIEPEVEFLSRIIHCISLLWCHQHGQSLGMSYGSLRHGQSQNRHIDKPQNLSRPSLLQQKTSLRFFFIYAITIYIIRRVRRNGWDDTIPINIINNNDRKKSVQLEQLRGQGRRKMYEKMRKMMLQRAVHSEQIHENEKLGVQYDNEKTKSDDQTTTTKKRQQNTKQSSIFDHCVYLQKLRVLISNILHKLSFTSISLDTTVAPTSRNNSNEQNTITMLIRWSIQVNLALFYINGKYPSILHRFFGMNMYRSNVSNDNDESAPQRLILAAIRPSYQILGLLMLLNRGTKLVEELTKASLDILRRFRTLWNRERRPQIIIAKLERNIPSRRPHIMRNDSNGIIKLRGKQNHNQCGICKITLIQPSASSQCGHVFCWDCICQYMSVRKQCPICRSPITLQEIVPLYNYK